jgi:hypothetical protein
LVNGKARLSIQRSPEQPHTVLPSWLWSPYVQVVPETELQYQPFMAPIASPPSQLVRAGDRVEPVNGPGGNWGTLGCFLKSGSAYFGLTAGHVLAKHGPHWTITPVHGKGPSAFGVHVPVMSADLTDRLRMEVELIKIRPDSVAHIDTNIPRIRTRRGGSSGRAHLHGREDLRPARPHRQRTGPRNSA